MATEAGIAPVNGTYAHQNAYGSAEHSFGHQASTSTSTTGYGAAPVSGSGPTQNEISKEEVAWYFVESYYTTMSRTSEKLHLFYNKRSQLVCGVEEQKSAVASGQKAIKQRLAELDYQDSKVRVTNVDSQASDNNIVIQVLGEMSNKSQPHRKFAQTFVLAGQTNGYFVLNDIFRFIKDDEEEPEVEALQSDAGAVPAGVQEPTPTTAAPEPATSEAVVHEEDIATVDKKLEEVQHEEAAKEETPAATTNGTSAPEEAEVEEVEEAPAEVETAPEAKVEEVEAAAAEEALEPEKPTDPVPSPAPAQITPAPVASAPAAPPKPAVPRTWAQLASANRAAAAQAAAPTAAAPQPKASTPAPAAAAAAAAAAAPTAPTSTSSPAPVSAREGATSENKEDGWQTAGADHTRKQSRAQNAPAVGSDGRVRAYVKNVSANLDAETLKTYLTKFGELVYFDVARGKNAAFVEYKTLGGFQAAVNANPHTIGTDEVYIEERRIPGPFNNARGGARGGRGGFERPTGGRGSFKGSDAPRGGAFSGRGRGSNGVPSRGGRGAAQTA